MPSSSRQKYEPIGEGKGEAAFAPSQGIMFDLRLLSTSASHIQAYGSLYQGHDVDTENPFSGPDDAAVHVTRPYSTESDPSRKRFLWWVLGPAITLLLVIAVAVAVASQTAPSATSGPATPTLGISKVTGPLLVKDPPAPPTTDSVPTPATPEIGPTVPAAPAKPTADGDSPDTADDDDDTPMPQLNTTAVLSCLEDECQPLVTQLGKTWRDLANINLLRCLASAAFNKTAASTCFRNAGPSELRDDLVACAGCNGCIKLKDQASIDRACAKYDAWSEKKKAEAAAADADDDTASSSSPALVAEEGAPLQPPQSLVSGSESLASALPKELREKYCSQFWCP